MSTLAIASENDRYEMLQSAPSVPDSDVESSTETAVDVYQNHGVRTRWEPKIF